MLLRADLPVHMLSTYEQVVLIYFRLLFSPSIWSRLFYLDHKPMRAHGLLLPNLTATVDRLMNWHYLA